jgi:hypothetical protein
VSALTRIWPVGAQILLRHVLAGRTWSALPVTVVADDATSTVVRIHAGSRWLAAVGPDGRRRHGWHRSWRLAEVAWTGHDVTYLLEPDRWQGTAVCTDAATGTVAKFYINGQDPVRRTPWGLDTMDRELDAVLHPGTRKPRWKDAHRFARLLASRAIGPRAAWSVVRATRAAARMLSADAAARTRLREWARPEWPVPDLGDVFASVPLPPDLAARGSARPRPDQEEP